MKAVIIDDEDGNIVVLKKQLQQFFPSIRVVATSTDSRASVQLIGEHCPDLLFLDIDMPGLNGFELVEEIRPTAAEIIFVTGYSEFALQAFEYQASGYITKPVNAEKLVVTVNKAVERIVQKETFSKLNKTVALQDTKKIPLSTQKGLVFVDPDAIYYCESSGNYTTFFLKDNQQVLVSKQIGQFEQLLPKNVFVRIHERYIINLRYIKEYHRGAGGSVVLENGKELPVAVRRKETLLKCFTS